HGDVSKARCILRLDTAEYSNNRAPRNSGLGSKCAYRRIAITRSCPATRAARAAASRRPTPTASSNGSRRQPRGNCRSAHQSKRAPDHELLDAAVVDVLQEIVSERYERFSGARCGRAHRVQRLPPRRVVDASPVVRIDQAQLPQLAALVDIRQTGRGELEQG